MNDTQQRISIPGTGIYFLSTASFAAFYTVLPTIILQCLCSKSTYFVAWSNLISSHSTGTSPVV
jgi:hypothetical protein